MCIRDRVYSPSTGKAQFKVEAQDSSGIHRVVVAYTTGSGVWRSLELQYDASLAKWTGSASLGPQAKFFVQAVDGAGNVAVDANKGAYYDLGLMEARELPYNIYLPFIVKTLAD